MLNDKQIGYLFKFCEKHLVYYYEVQVELVDHLANGIEEEMKKDKKLTFESALQIEYSKFGIMGFSLVVREKQNQMFKKSRLEFLRLVLMQFRWPAVLIFLLTGSFFYTVSLWNQNVSMILVIILLSGGAIRELFIYREISKQLKKTGKKFLLVQNYVPIGFTWFYIYFYFILGSEKLGWSNISSNPLVVGIFTALATVFLVASVQLFRQIRERLFHEFPGIFNPA